MLQFLSSGFYFFLLHRELAFRGWAFFYYTRERTKLQYEEEEGFPDTFHVKIRMHDMYPYTIYCQCDWCPRIDVRRIYMTLETSGVV